MMARETVRPPTPESKIPNGAFARGRSDGRLSLEDTLVMVYEAYVVLRANGQQARHTVSQLTRT
ncbi:hypothetical protein GCM10009715_04820 [Paeniglutamicibacter psychrophenolicus]